MGTESRSRYTEEFKIDALKLAKSLGNYTEAAKRLGVSDSLLHSWKKTYNITIDSDKSVEKSFAEAEELKRLRKENEELKKINYILKRAAAFFSQDHLK
jgi:transposase